MLISKGDSGQALLRYAQAFCDFYIHKHPERDLASLQQQVQRLSVFFKDNAQVPVLWTFKGIPADVIESVMKNLQERLLLDDEVLHWLKFIIAKRQSLCLRDICLQIVNLLWQRRQVMPCEVTSAQPLTVEQRLHVEEVFSNRLQKRLAMSFIVDPKLIFGLRIQAENYLWEDSVARRLAWIARKRL